MSRMLVLKEAYLLAALPLVGITLVACHQMGAYGFYGVPIEFLELDTMKVILSGLSLALYGAAATYAITSIFHEDPAPTKSRRLIGHVLAASLLTVPFWSKNISVHNGISWPTLLFIAFCATVTFCADHYLRKFSNNDDKPTLENSLGTICGVGFWVILLVLTATFLMGYLTARDAVSRMFIENTNLIVVARIGDTLVAKEYNTKTATINKGETTLFVVDKTTTLVKRNAAIKN